MNCPICSQRVVLPAKGNDILWLASEPSEEEYNRRQQLSGTLGSVLRQEFRKASADIDPFEFSRAFMWFHPQTKNNECLSCSLDAVFDKRLLSHIRHVILVGSLATKHFTGHSITDVSGLNVRDEFIAWEAFPKLLTVTAMVNPLMALGKGVGELRLAINGFVNTMLTADNEQKTLGELYG